MKNPQGSSGKESYYVLSREYCGLLPPIPFTSN